MATRALVGLVVAFLLAAVSPVAAIGEFWAITTEPVTIGGQQVPAGMFVPIAYDGINFWYSSGFKDADHISKSSVQLLKRVIPDAVLPHAVLDGHCKFYSPSPKIAHPLHSLMTEELAEWAPSVVGTFHFLYKEGNTFVVRYNGPNNSDADYWEQTRRVDASCIRFDHGKSFSGLAATPPFISEAGLLDKPMSMWSAGDYIGQFVTIALIGGGLLVAVWLAGAVAYRASRA